jgi:hypothetical protein
MKLIIFSFLSLLVYAGIDNSLVDHEDPDYTDICME